MYVFMYTHSYVYMYVSVGHQRQLAQTCFLPVTPSTYLFMCFHLYICISEGCFFGSEGMRLHLVAYAPDAPTSDASRPAAPASMVAVIFVLHCPETVRCLDENLERKGQRVFLTLCWQWALCERHNENCERRYMADEDACVRMYRRHRTSRGTFTPDSFTESESDMLSSASSDVFWGISPRLNLS